MYDYDGNIYLLTWHGMAWHFSSFPVASILVPSQIISCWGPVCPTRPSWHAANIVWHQRPQRDCGWRSSHSSADSSFLLNLIEPETNQVVSKIHMLLGINDANLSFWVAMHVSRPLPIKYHIKTWRHAIYNYYLTLYAQSGSILNCTIYLISIVDPSSITLFQLFSRFLCWGFSCFNPAELSF